MHRRSDQRSFFPSFQSASSSSAHYSSSFSPRQRPTCAGLLPCFALLASFLLFVAFAALVFHVFSSPGSSSDADTADADVNFSPIRFNESAEVPWGSICRKEDIPKKSPQQVDDFIQKFRQDRSFNASSSSSSSQRQRRRFAVVSLFAFPANASDAFLNKERYEEKKYFIASVKQKRRTLLSTYHDVRRVELLQRYSFLNKLQYCALNDYDCVLEDESAVDSRRDPRWSKVRVLRKYVGLYEKILWIDADAFVQNLSWRFEKLFDEEIAIAAEIEQEEQKESVSSKNSINKANNNKNNKIDVVMMQDWRGLNSGVAIFRGCAPDEQQSSSSSSATHSEGPTALQKQKCWTAEALRHVWRTSDNAARPFADQGGYKHLFGFSAGREGKGAAENRKHLLLLGPDSSDAAAGHRERDSSSSSLGTGQRIGGGHHRRQRRHHHRSSWLLSRPKLQGYPSALIRAGLTASRAAHYSAFRNGDYVVHLPSSSFFPRSIHWTAFYARRYLCENRGDSVVFDIDDEFDVMEMLRQDDEERKAGKTRPGSVVDEQQQLSWRLPTRLVPDLSPEEEEVAKFPPLDEPYDYY